jgi:hypothetical protein
MRSKINFFLNIWISSNLSIRKSEEQKEDDNKFKKKVHTFSWIKPQHLELDPKFSSDDLWDTAEQELERMNEFRTPNLKITCILNACKILMRTDCNISFTAHLHST